MVHIPLIIHLFCIPLCHLFLHCRVKGMLMINVLAVVAGLLMGLCRMWKPHIMVIAGRAVMGLYCGTVKQMQYSQINIYGHFIHKWSYCHD